MKKYIIPLLFTLIFVFSVSVNIPTVNAQNLNISQFIELLISIGVIAPDKVEAARAVTVQLNVTPVMPTPTDVIATSTSYIQVLTPNGGESWAIDLDLPYKITWGSNGLTQAYVSLVDTKGKVCNLHTSPVNSKNGNREFSVLLKNAQCFSLTTGTSTALTDGTYKARVYYTDSVGTTIKDESNATFKITPVLIPSIKVTYPNGGETLKRNTEYDVKYSLKNVTSVTSNLIYLYLLDNNGNIAYNSHKTKRSDGTYSLDLPSSLPVGAYKIKLKTTTTDKVEIEDSSDNFFWITTSY